MCRSNQRFFKVFIATVITACMSCAGFSQSISRPSTGNACFVLVNELQNISVEISGGPIANGTSFVLRLSNKEGGFNSNSIIVAETTNSGNNIDFIDFSYPIIDGEGTTLASDEYRLRVEQLNGTLQSSRSNQFSAFFYDLTVLELNPRVLCEFGQLRAVPDNLPIYVWHRITDALGDQIIPGENTNTLEANVEGRYYFTPPLGECAPILPEARSNFVTVFEAVATQVPSFSISLTSGQNPFCADESSVTLSSSFVDTAFSYQWIRNDVAISGETNPTITVSDINSEGMYFLEISDDNQRAEERCATQSQNEIFIDLNNPFINFAANQSLIVPDIPGEEEVLTVEATGQSPITITWFKDNVAIANSNSPTITATGPGNYTAMISGSSCNTFNEDTTDTAIQVIPIDNLTVTLNYDNPGYAPCILSRVGVNISTISTTVNNSVIEIPRSNFNNFGISWFNNNEELTQFTGSSIIIDNAGGNGNYFAEITLGTVVFTSNILPVQLNPGELAIEAFPTILDESNPTSNLSVPLTDEAIASLYTYLWFREDFNAPNGQAQISTSSSVEINEAGNYFVEVTFDNCPAVRLNTVFISEASVVIPNILTPNGSNNRRWQLPVQFTGQPNVNVQIISSTGVEVLNQNNYNGTWPDDELLESVYYYIISENNNPLEKGSITIIR